MTRVEIRCRGILPGKAAGRAMVLANPISFQGEIDEVIEKLIEKLKSEQLI